MSFKQWLIIVSVAALVTIAGLANGFMDKMQFHYSTSVFPQTEQETYWGKGPQFWNPRESWKNKYKDWDGGDRRPAFLGSTGPLVFLTDGWHLFQMIMLTCYQLAIAIPLVTLLRIRWYWAMLALAPAKVLFGLGFFLMYNVALKRRQTAAA